MMNTIHTVALDLTDPISSITLGRDEGELDADLPLLGIHNDDMVI